MTSNLGFYCSKENISKTVHFRDKVTRYYMTLILNHRQVASNGASFDDLE